MTPEEQLIASAEARNAELERQIAEVNKQAVELNEQLAMLRWAQVIAEAKLRRARGLA